MKLRGKLGWALGIFGIGGGLAYAVDCGICTEHMTRLRGYVALQEKTTQLLGKNKTYLANLSADEASKHLKVQSNLVMILKKLDSIKADSKKTQDQYSKLGCESCPKGESI